MQQGRLIAGTCDNMFNKTAHPLLDTLGVVLAAFYPEAVKLHGGSGPAGHYSSIFNGGIMKKVAEGLDGTAVAATDMMAGLCQTKDGIEHSIAAGEPLKTAFQEGLAAMEICVAGLEDAQVSIAQTMEGLRSAIENMNPLKEETGTTTAKRARMDDSEADEAEGVAKQAEEEENEEEDDAGEGCSSFSGVDVPEAGIEIEVITSE